MGWLRFCLPLLAPIPSADFSPEDSSHAGQAGSANVIQDVLNELHSRFASLDEGEVASYIPELAKACPQDFGIAITTASGRIYEVGDTRKPFTIQSISKPFVFGLGIKLLTPELLALKVDVEPSGEAFNAISLDPDTGKPRNPMINAGAIAISAQISAHDPLGADQLVLDFFSELAARALEVDQAVYQSESETGHRNRAIGYLLRNSNIIEAAPEPGLDLYFRQCAISVDCRDLAVMAATLACQGRNPITGRQPLSPDISVRVLALMGSCGMYDFAGQWLHDVGIPAKSGVAGGVLAVVPGRLGIAVYSPPLDGFGNSVRGVAVCTQLSHGVGMSLFNQSPQAGNTIRRVYSGSQRTSRRWRSERELALLQPHRDRLRIIQVQGVLDFAALEQLAAAVVALPPQTRVLILDMAHVTELPPSSDELLNRQLRLLLERGLQVLVSRAGRLAMFQAAGQQLEGLQLLDQLDFAIETAENLLMEGASGEQPISTAADSEACFLSRLPSESRAALEALLLERGFQPGEAVINRGDPGNELFLVRDGLFSTHIEFEALSGEPHRTRLATFGPGMCFGEIAFITGNRRIADITAVDGGRCWVLQRSDFENLQERQPAVALDLLKALTCDLGLKLSQTSVQLSRSELV